MKDMVFSSDWHQANVARVPGKWILYRVEGRWFTRMSDERGWIGDVIESLWITPKLSMSRETSCEMLNKGLDHLFTIKPRKVFSRMPGPLMAGLVQYQYSMVGSDGEVVRLESGR